MDRGSPREAVLMAVAAVEPVSLRDLSSGLDLSAEEVRAAVAEAVAGGELLALGGGPPTEGTLLYTSGGFAALWDRLSDAVSAYHRQFPLRRGISREELRSRLGLESRPFDQAIALLAARGE
jgi:selenocysteine-specific elongation factor